jgi:hypothetical protein
MIWFQACGEELLGGGTAANVASNAHVVYSMVGSRLTLESPTRNGLERADLAPPENALESPT